MHEENAWGKWRGKWHLGKQNTIVTEDLLGFLPYFVTSLLAAWSRYAPPVHPPIARYFMSLQVGSTFHSGLWRQMDANRRHNISCLYPISQKPCPYLGLTKLQILHKKPLCIDGKNPVWFVLTRHHSLISLAAAGAFFSRRLEFDGSCTASPSRAAENRLGKSSTLVAMLKLESMLWFHWTDWLDDWPDFEFNATGALAGYCN